MNDDPEWLRQAAEREDGQFVSVGGLVTDLEPAEPKKLPVHVFLPLELSGRGNHVDRLWYAIEVLKVRDFTLEADFQPFTLKRESTTDMPWGAVQSVKRWHLEVETLDAAQRQVVMKPYRVARSKSDHLLETLEACGWKRVWELERSTP